MIDAFRIGKAYTVTQAARLAGTSAQNVSRWLRGYVAPGHRMAPVFGKQRGKAPLSISFLELAEIIVVARFRQPDDLGRRRISLDRLRRAHQFARTAFQLDYPFASLELRLEGGHILHEFDTVEPDGAALALDLHGQWVLPLPVRSALDLFEYDDGLASRWFPLGRNGPIVVDPHVGGGRPVIAGTGVTVDVIRNRFEAGESIRSIARDFEVETSAVEQALRYAAA